MAQLVSHGNEDGTPVDIAEKAEALKGWLSNQMGAEVDTGFDPVSDTYWFRILLDVPLPPMLSVRQSAFEDHSVEEIRNDLQLFEVPGILGKDPAPHLIYERMGDVKKITLMKLIEGLL